MHHSFLRSRLAIFLSVGLLGVATFFLFRPSPSDTSQPGSRSPQRGEARWTTHGKIVNWWGFVPDLVKVKSLNPADHSNIQPGDYAGAESCRKCHQQNYESWSTHPHRWMNAIADESTVRGDFSGACSISYRGGTAYFYQDQDEYRMRLERGDIQRVFKINQTIGSRFYQYYVGTLVSGPEPKDSPRYTVDHVLPFGYWLEQREWVPTVHVNWLDVNGAEVDEEDVPSDRRPDPFAAPDQTPPFTAYFRCNQCHSTFSLGDLLVNNTDTLGRHLNVPIHFDALGYLHDTHKEMFNDSADINAMSDADVTALRDEAWKFEAPEHAVNMGISCEACHLGSREHAEGTLKKPYFFPRNAHLYVEETGNLAYGRNHDNLNWACARCHTGNRRQLAGGMATWNSTEFTDAMRGSCYSKLKCVDCHNPHQATGRSWSHPPEHDDQSCLKCHEDLKPPATRLAHTHHPAGSSGARCMNCHMPRVNEGLQDVVRTHMIYSPTNRQMIEANQPNACNQCHVKESIQWTLKHLHEWYAAGYDPKAIEQHYPDREGSVALGWLQSSDQSVRLIGADSLFRTASHWALPQLIEALDDSYLMNRQFAQRGIESLTGVNLEDFGYRYYMERDERSEALKAVRRKLLKQSAPAPDTTPSR